MSTFKANRISNRRWQKAFGYLFNSLLCSAVMLCFLPETSLGARGGAKSKSSNIKVSTESIKSTKNKDDLRRKTVGQVKPKNEPAIKDFVKFMVKSKVISSKERTETENALNTLNKSNALKNLSKEANPIISFTRNVLTTTKRAKKTYSEYALSNSSAKTLKVSLKFIRVLSKPKNIQFLAKKNNIDAQIAMALVRQLPKILSAKTKIQKELTTTMEAVLMLVDSGKNNDLGVAIKRYFEQKYQANAEAKKIDFIEKCK